MLHRQRGGCNTHREGGCNSTPAMFSPALFGFFVLDRPTQTAPAVQGRTGATPPFSPLVRHGEEGGASPGATPGATSHPRRRWGRSRLHVSLREGSPAHARAGRRAERSGPMLDRLIRAFLVVGGVSVAGAWTWPGPFPEADPLAVLVRYHTPNVYTGRRRVVLRGARRGGVPGRAIPYQHIPDLVRPDGRPCGAPVPPSGVATFAHGRRPGHRHRRGPPSGESHREPGFPTG